MTIWEAIILGIVQGFTEFFPVSSSGHIFLFSRMLGLDSPSMAFTLAVHLATLVAVCSVLWKDILILLKKPFQKLTLLLVIASVPVAFAGLLLNDLLDSFNDSMLTLGIGFLVTTAFLALAASFREGDIKKEDIKWYDALFIGVMQMIAILPGISRSGSTLTAGLFRRMKKEDGVKFSFLLSIPVILGGFLVQGFKAYKLGFVNIDILPTLVGMVFAGVTGFFAVKIFLRTVMKGKIKYFAYYTGALGVFCILDQFLFKLLT